MDAEYEPYQDELSLAGLGEEELRKMEPDAQVTMLEQTRFDPYDYICFVC